MSVKAHEAPQTKSWRWFLLWAQRVRDDAQTGRPKTIRPALALANIGAQPGFRLCRDLRTQNDDVISVLKLASEILLDKTVKPT